MSQKPKFYNLVMFSYPSSDKLHMGHWYNYAPADTYGRYKKLRGFDVFQPIGFDSFGLPAENYAIETGVVPSESIAKNISKMRDQLIQMGSHFDWSAYLETSNSNYYQWTQWLFLQLFNKGLAYKQDALVNYCGGCETVISNEQCKNGHCERCNERVHQKLTPSWFLKITDYKERLLKGLDDLDWPETTKTLQRNWLNQLHDWCISRQRYWGTPIPIVYDPNDEAHAVQGLWELPTDVDFKPDGTSPLARSEELKARVVERFGEGWTPETDTMDTFVDSSFYFIQYLRQAKKVPKRWLPVDLCVGGIEHADKHLIYARFITMFLHDIGVSPVEEPFAKIIHQGIIKNKGKKMSKSKGNAVDPTPYVDKYGSDALRLHLMFMGPYEKGGEWNDKSIVAMKRFLNAIDRKFNLPYRSTVVGQDVVNNLIHKVTKSIESFRFNLAIAEFMKFIKRTGDDFIQFDDKHKIIIALSPLAPKTATSLWESKGGKGSLFSQSWPEFWYENKDKSKQLQNN